MEEMDRPIDSAIQRRQKIHKWAPAIGITIVGVLAIVLVIGWLRPAVKRDRIRTAFVEIGDVSATIDASGLVVPEYEQTLTAPIATRVVQVLLKAGARVEPGEAIALLDDTDARRDVNRIEEQIALKVNSRRKSDIELARSKDDLIARRDIKALEVESFNFELERNRKMFDRGLIVEDNVRLSETDLERATIELRHLEAQLVNSGEDSAARLEGLRLEISILEKDLVRAQKRLDRTRVTAARTGIVTWVVTAEGIAVGEGEPVATVADLSAYRVDATISDVLARKLTVGLPAVVRSGDTRLPGRVTKVLPTVQNGIVTFEVALDEYNHTVLRPNLRVDVHAVTALHTNTLCVKRGPVLNYEGQDWMFVIRGDKAIKTPIIIGLSNFEEYEITEGLFEGDEVIISDMSKYIRAKEVNLQ